VRRVQGAVRQPFCAACMAEANRQAATHEPGGVLVTSPVPVAAGGEGERCGCGCGLERGRVVREVARTMFLNEEQADALVPFAPRPASPSEPSS